MAKHIFLFQAMKRNKDEIQGTPGYDPLPLEVFNHKLRMSHMSVTEVSGDLLFEEIRHYLTIVDNKKKINVDRQRALKILKGR